MEMVAAAKMRRAQIQALSMRPYAEKAREILIRLGAQRGANEGLHPLLMHQPSVDRIGLVVVTSNKGLCGGYNHNIIRLAHEFVRSSTTSVDVISVGRIGRNTMVRLGDSIVADFDHLTDQPSLDEVRPIARLVMDDFLSGGFDEVYLAYTDFVNTMVQKPVIRPFLPFRGVHGLNPENAGIVQKAPAAEARDLVEYIFEPSPRDILDVVMPRFTELQVYEAILEAVASEHSARMVAMRAATENAKELIGHLTLTYNRARQELITKEMIDIVGGTEALKNRKGAAIRQR